MSQGKRGKVYVCTHVTKGSTVCMFLYVTTVFTIIIVFSFIICH